MRPFDRFGKKKADVSSAEIEEYDDTLDVRDADGMDEHDDGETLSVSDATDIWASYGKDEDYMLGYTAEELKKRSVTVFSSNLPFCPQPATFLDDARADKGAGIVVSAHLTGRKARNIRYENCNVANGTKSKRAGPRRSR